MGGESTGYDRGFWRAREGERERRPTYGQCDVVGVETTGVKKRPEALLKTGQLDIKTPESKLWTYSQVTSLSWCILLHSRPDRDHLFSQIHPWSGHEDNLRSMERT